MATFDPARLDEALKKAPQQLYERLVFNIDQMLEDFTKGTMPRVVRSNMRIRSAMLWKSFKHRRKGKDLKSVTWSAFTDSAYARIHEFGGKIEPREVQWLTIPMSKTYETKTGRARSGALFVQGKTFWAWSGGNLYLFRKTGKKRGPKWAQRKQQDPDLKDPSIEALFKLVKLVKVPARLGFFDAWDKEQDKFRDAVSRSVDEALDALGGGNAQP